MNYIVTLYIKDSEKPRRFINPISSEWIDPGKLPSNCHLVKEKDSTDLSQLGLVNDGFVPVFFVPDKLSSSSYRINSFDGQRTMAIMLVVAGFCQRGLTEKTTPSLIIRHCILGERLEALQKESEKHTKILTSFVDREKHRKSFFDLPPWVIEEITVLTNSKTRILQAADDISKILGEREKRALQELTRQVDPNR